MFQKGANLAAMLVVSRYNYPVQVIFAVTNTLVGLLS